MLLLHLRRHIWCVISSVFSCIFTVSLLEGKGMFVCYYLWAYLVPFPQKINPFKPQWPWPELRNNATEDQKHTEQRCMSNWRCPTHSHVSQCGLFFYIFLGPCRISVLKHYKWKHSFQHWKFGANWIWMVVSDHQPCLRRATFLKTIAPAILVPTWLSNHRLKKFLIN